MPALLAQYSLAWISGFPSAWALLTSPTTPAPAPAMTARRAISMGFLLRFVPTIANRAMRRQYPRHDSALEMHRMEFDRRTLLTSALTSAGSLALGAPAFAQSAAQPFEVWLGAFHGKASAKGISDATFTRVLGSIKPDLTVF